MLLLYGSGLSGAHASLPHVPAGVMISKQKSGKDGLYYFVYLSGTERAQPGDLTIQLAGPNGRKQITVPLRARVDQPRPGPLTGNDVMYLIMPDRFADGDLANDHPVNSVPIDRSAARAYHGGDLRWARGNYELNVKTALPGCLELSRGAPSRNLESTRRRLNARDLRLKIAFHQSPYLMA